MKAISLIIVSPINESNNDRQDKFRHESYSHQSVYYWQWTATTSKGRSTSCKHIQKYDDHVTHFLHDNVTVEFHYWNDQGIFKQRTLRVNSNQPLTCLEYKYDLWNFEIDK